MTKIIELNLAQTKAIVGGAVAASSVIVTKSPSVSLPPMNLPMSGQVSPQTSSKRYDPA